MARYKFFLMGSRDAPVVEVAADTISDLKIDLSRNRFIEGRMVEIDEAGSSCGVLISCARVQLVREIG